MTDETLRFNAISRRNSLLGLFMADFEEAGDEDVIRKVVSDLNRAGVPADEGRVRRVLAGMGRATEEIQAGT